MEVRAKLRTDRVLRHFIRRFRPHDWHGGIAGQKPFPKRSLGPYRTEEQERGGFPHRVNHRLHVAGPPTRGGALVTIICR